MTGWRPACDPGDPFDRPPGPRQGAVISIPVVDIFAGAGGLGEGFSAYKAHSSSAPPFRLVLSAEMDAHAVSTLRTRAFFRQFAHGKAPDSYYDYAAGKVDVPWTSDTKAQWAAACKEALQLELGEQADDKVLHEHIGKIHLAAKKSDTPWILVGGPPCQAYSLVGRSRNRGNAEYVAGDDHRHYLYEHYLAIIAKFRPAAFVLENVKGMLSAKIDEVSIFDEIFERMQKPGGKSGPRYRIVPLIKTDTEDGEWAPRDFLVRAERLGLPQARHRVILVGLLEDLGHSIKPLVAGAPSVTVEDMIEKMPAIRSSLTDDQPSAWPSYAHDLLLKCAEYAKSIDSVTGQYLALLAESARLSRDLDVGSKWIPGEVAPIPHAKLDSFIRDPRLKGYIGHHSRGHMKSDLMRYGYAAAFARVHGHSPRGSVEFPDALHPEHKSWLVANRFIDRFKVQRWDSQSSTITSHLAKDGHYFIHPDARQLRSLTVREAARLQTFPDNYIFEGTVGAQRKQVGNAVPPWLAYKIAGVIHDALK